MIQKEAAMKKIIFAVILVFLYSCNHDISKTIDPEHKFQIGNVVCNKAGGPPGTVNYLPDKSSFQYHLIRIRFYEINKTTNNIAIGGAALLGGGDASVSNNGFYEVWMREEELKSCER